MISGFSKPQNPRFIHFIIPKCFKQYKSDYGEILAQYDFRKSRNQTNWDLLKVYVLFLDSPLCLLEMSGISCFIKLYEDGHREMMKIPVNKCSTSWIWISYLSKSMKREFGNFCNLKGVDPLGLSIKHIGPPGSNAKNLQSQSKEQWSGAGGRGRSP